jgi:hypothetical protein
MTKAKSTEKDDLVTKGRHSNAGEVVGRRIVFIRDGQAVRSRSKRRRTLPS